MSVLRLFLRFQFIKRAFSVVLSFFSLYVCKQIIIRLENLHVKVVFG